MLQHALAQQADIAGKPVAGERGDEIEARSRPPRPRIDDEHQPPDAALVVLLGQAGDLGVDRAGDLLGDQAPRVPGEIAEQEGRKQREDREIDQRQLERGGVEQLAERVMPRPRQPSQRDEPVAARSRQARGAVALRVRQASPAARDDGFICHGSCTRRREWCAAAAARIPCRSWSAAARCARR